MATEKATGEVSDANCSSNTNHAAAATDHNSQDDKVRPESSLCKALAHRSLYRSNSSRLGRGRKIRYQDLKALPSRLGKVSLADQTEIQ